MAQDSRPGFSVHSDPLSQLATPILRLDGEQRIRDLNPACASWLGLSRRRLQGQPLAQLDGSGGALCAASRQVLEEGASLRCRHLRLEVDSGERFAEVYLTREFEGEGLLLEFHPSEAFPGSDPSVLPAALNAALKGLAHEVRNPLAGLKGAAQLLARRIEDADSRRYVEVILTESARLADLVERLLTPTAPRELVPTNVHAVLERVRLLAEAEAGWAIQLLRDYDPSLPEPAADADRLAQALWNLVRNALQSGASIVRLRSRAEHGVLIGENRYRLGIRLEVEDNGRGVPETLAERIFLPLVSGRPEGSGLGLALAQQVAREHGGALSFRSRPGHTVFTLQLPVRESHPNENAHAD
jgi:two-component system, NtrC family, nitrogen regulation sensor histidine kinase GlnL